MSERVHYLKAAKMLGCCKRRILTEYIRLGVLPRPDARLTFSAAEVQKAMEYFDKRRALAKEARDARDA